MKRTCNGCKAFFFMGCGEVRCELGYTIDANKLKPLEDCPKPTTNIQLINCKKK